MLSTSVKIKMNLECIEKKILIKKILSIFCGYTDNSSKLRIYLYTFLYVIIILTYRKIFFHLYIISKKKFIIKNSIFSPVA